MVRVVRSELQPTVDGKPEAERKQAAEQADKVARKMVEGIKWKDDAENYARFGLPPAAQAQPIATTIDGIQKFLWETGAISKKYAPANQLYDPSILEAIKGGSSTERGTVVSVKERKLTFRAGAQEAAIDVPEGAEVSLDGKEAALTALTEGMSVEIERRDNAIKSVRGKSQPATTEAGMVVSAREGKLQVTLDPGGQAVTIAVPGDAKVSLDGNKAELTTLPAYADVVVEKLGDKVVAVRAQKPREERGTVASVAGKKLTMTNELKQDVVVEVPDTARVSLEDKPAGLSALLKGMPVTVVKRKSADVVVAVQAGKAPSAVTKKPLDYEIGVKDGEVSAISVDDLQEVLKLLKDDPKATLEIKGNSKGKSDEDKKPALERAQVVRDWFVNQGIAKERLTVEFGELGTAPVVKLVLVTRRE